MTCPRCDSPNAYPTHCTECDWKKGQILLRSIEQDGFFNSPNTGDRLAGMAIKQLRTALATSPVPAPTQETPERRVLENLRLYVAAEGHDERGKFIGLSWRGYDQWGPILRGKDDPFGFVEDVEKWLHEKIDAALASDAPVLYDEEVIQARNRDPAQPATDERIADQLESLLVDVTVLNPEEAAIVRRAAALLREQSKDARRYRWLRVQRHADIAACWYLPAHCDPAAFDTPEKRDEALDRAIEQRPESGT